MLFLKSPHKHLCIECRGGCNHIEIISTNREFRKIQRNWTASCRGRLSLHDFPPGEIIHLQPNLPDGVDVDIDHQVVIRRIGVNENLALRWNIQHFLAAACAKKILAAHHFRPIAQQGGSHPLNLAMGKQVDTLVIGIIHVVFHLSASAVTSLPEKDAL